MNVVGNIVVALLFLAAVAVTGDSLFLDLTVVLGLLAFLTTVTVARYIERRGT